MGTISWSKKLSRACKCNCLLESSISGSLTLMPMPIIILVSSYRKANSPRLRDRVHFIDTRFITDPMWDTALDFNHLHSRVGDAEALYIAGKVLLNSDEMFSDQI